MRIHSFQLSLTGVGLVAKSETNSKPPKDVNPEAKGHTVLLISDIAQEDREIIILSYFIVERIRGRRTFSTKPNSSDPFAGNLMMNGLMVA